VYVVAGDFPTTPGEVNVRLISLLSPFDRTQGSVCGGKVGLVTCKYQLDPVAWVLLGEINELMNCVRSSRGLATTPGAVNFDLFLSLVSLTAHKAPFVEEKSV